MPSRPSKNTTGKDNLIEALRAVADPQRAISSARFFKTGPGQYGAGDKFLGVTVPIQRRIAKDFYVLSLSELEDNLHSKWHEQRLTTLFILVHKYRCGDEPVKKRIYELYLRNLDWVNNWDLVDSSASYIVGDWLLERDRSLLYKLARSADLWRRRVAIISTARFIAAGQSDDTFKISKLLINDSHDLIHKAVGWMLREVGKRISRQTMEDFLLENGRYKTMPRTMLRYAIEHLPESRRQAYLAGNV